MKRNNYNSHYENLFKAKCTKLKIVTAKLLILVQKNKNLVQRIKEKNIVLLKFSTNLREKHQTIDKLSRKVKEIEDENQNCNSTNKIKRIFVGEDNINKYIERSKCMRKVNTKEGFLIFCNECIKMYPSKMKRKTFSNFVEYKGLLAKELEKGKCKLWYTLKSTLEKHIIGHKTKNMQISVTRKLLALSLCLCKIKGAWSSYEQLVGTTYCMDVNIGQICHGKNNMLEMIRTLRQITLNRLKHYLNTPQNHTGFPPHFCITFDKATINKVTNQALMLILSVDGSRVAFPIDCVPVYNLNQEGKVYGGKRQDLIELIKDGLMKKLGLSIENLSYLTAIYADGQYGINFHDNLKKDLGFQNDSIILSIWDTAHWLDLAVKQSGKIDFFKNFIMQSNKFTSVFGQGKGREELRGAAKVLGLKALEASSFSVTRFSSSCLKVLKTLLKSYPALIKAYKDSQESKRSNQEFTYFMENKNFLMDICIIIDILTPIGQLMEIVQSPNTSPWNICQYFPKLLMILNGMETNLKELLTQKVKIPEADYFPMLLDKWKEFDHEKIKSILKIYDEKTNYVKTKKVCCNIKRRKISKIKLNLTNICTTRNKSINGDFSVKDNNVNWNSRNIYDCLTEYLEFCKVLKTELKSRYDKAVEDKVIRFSKCFDMISMLETLAELSFYTGEEYDNSIQNYYDSGEKEFEIIYKSLLKLPQFQIYKSQKNSTDIYHNWKRIFFELIFNKTNFNGNWFLNHKNQPIIFHDSIKSICTIYKPGKISNYYKIILNNETIIDDAIFCEKNMIKYICTGESLMIDLELRLILDFIFATCGTEACVEGFFSEMKNHKRSGGQNSENIVDASIIDFIFPEPRLCWEFLNYAAEQYINGNTEMGLFAHREPLFKTNKHKPWIVSKVLDRRSQTEVKFPFLFSISESNN